MKISKLITHFQKYQLWPSKELSISIKYANEVLAYCNEQDIIIIGIEGVIFQSGSIVPKMDWIYDSGSGVTNNVNKGARLFINAAKEVDDLAVIFTFEELELR